MPFILERNHGKKLDRVGVSPLVLLLAPYIPPPLLFPLLRLLRSGYDAPKAHYIITLINILCIVINTNNDYIRALIIRYLTYK